MPEYGVKISGLNDVTRQLKAVAGFLNDPKPMQNVVNDVRAGIIAKTAAGHDYRGRNFKPLSKAYAKRKGKTRANLNDTGEMMGSLTAEVVTSRHGRVEVKGSRALIAQFHTQGGPKPGRPPQREFLNITPSALMKIVKVRLDDELMKVLGRK